MPITSCHLWQAELPNLPLDKTCWHLGSKWNNIPQFSSLATLFLLRGTTSHLALVFIQVATLVTTQRTSKSFLEMLPSALCLCHFSFFLHSNREQGKSSMVLFGGHGARYAGSPDGKVRTKDMLILHNSHLLGSSQTPEYNQHPAAVLSWERGSHYQPPKFFCALS